MRLYFIDYYMDCIDGVDVTNVTHLFLFFYLNKKYIIYPLVLFSSVSLFAVYQNLSTAK